MLQFLEDSHSVVEFERGLHDIPTEFNTLYGQILKRIEMMVAGRKRDIIKEVIRIVITSP